MKTDPIWEGREAMKDGLARQHPWIAVLWNITSGGEEIEKQKEKRRTTWGKRREGDRKRGARPYKGRKFTPGRRGK